MMPLFRATFFLSSGREVRENIQGTNPAAVRALLCARGVFPTAIREIGPPSQQRRLRIPVKTLARLLHQLDMQIRAGVDEIGAVASLKDSHSSPKVRVMLNEVHASLAVAKTSFAEALGAFPRVIPTHLRAIIAAGEGTGPENTADRLADVREWLLFTDRIKRTFRRATAYPAFLGLLAIGYLIFFIVWFIPRFKVLLGSFGMQLPGYTQAIIDGADWLSHHGLLLLLVLMALLGAGHFLRQLDSVALAWDRLALRLPFYRKIYQAIVTSQICKNYRALILSGATADEALQLCAEMLSNRAARTEIRRLRREMHDTGASLGTALRYCAYFPPEAVSVITTAEATGHLPKALHELAAEYEETARESVEVALGVMSPALVIVPALVVGAILVGLFLPMAKLFENIR